MECIVFGLMAIFILYGIITSIVNWITDNLEEKAIVKSNIKQEIQNITMALNEELSNEIQAYKKMIVQFKEQTLIALPGLSGRIKRDNNRQTYIKEVLPYKKKTKRRR